MSRVRSSIKLALFSVTMLAVLGAGCIFSPDKNDNGGGECTTCPVEYPAIVDATSLIENLRLAYQKRDIDKFETLLHPDYQFRLNQPADDGTDYWGAVEEIKIHRRMFRPSEIPPTDPPLPTELWLSSVDITLTGSTVFDERPEYYFNAQTNPEGLERSNWEVSGADYNAVVFFETQGETDYRVEGRAEFVVARDLTKAVDAPGAWLLYRWSDLGALKPTLASAM